jgi:hypothetical protein
MEKYDHKDRFLYLANDTKLIRYYPFESLFVMNWIFFFPVKKSKYTGYSDTLFL